MDADELAAAILKSDASAIGTQPLKGIKVIAPDGYAVPPLELAARVGNDAVLRALLPLVEAKSASETLVLLAGENRDARAVRALLDAGVPASVEALDRAAGNGASKNVFRLLKAGVRVPRPENGYSSDFPPLSRDLMDSAMDGALKAPWDFIDQPSLVKRVRVWVSWLASLDAAKTEATYAVGVDGGQLVLATKEGLERKLKAGSDEQRVRFNFGDFAFRSGFSPKFAPSEVVLDESVLAKRGDEDDRTEAQLSAELLEKNASVIFREFKLTPDFRVIVKGHPF
ncbi:MAG: hypothetical protein JNM17_28380 [Archangium sp.]|nr:hypothetical protein [Archangium sp.]